VPSCEWCTIQVLACISKCPSIQWFPYVPHKSACMLTCVAACRVLLRAVPPLPSACSPSCVLWSGPCTLAHPSTGPQLWWQCCLVSASLAFVMVPWAATAVWAQFCQCIRMLSQGAQVLGCSGKDVVCRENALHLSNAAAAATAAMSVASAELQYMFVPCPADGQLYQQWKQELAAMSSRIIDMRKALHAELRAVSYTAASLYRLAAVKCDYCCSVRHARRRTCSAPGGCTCYAVCMFRADWVLTNSLSHA
jgi:hypothetical protein